MSGPIFIEKLSLRRFRSVRGEEVTFDSPLFLVGRNGAGKSNVVDAFAFLADCMTLPFHSAMARRGGKAEIVYCREPIGMVRAPRFALRVDFKIDGPAPKRGHYALSGGWFPLLGALVRRVGREQCFVVDESGAVTWFDRDNNAFRTNATGLRPAIDSQALALPIVGGIEAFAPVLKSLASMRVYSLDPGRIRDANGSGEGAPLDSDGANLSYVHHRLTANDPQMEQRINELLRAVAPEIRCVRTVPDPGRNDVFMSFEPTRPLGVVPPGLQAGSISDGTLRALGLILIALQDPAPSLIAIEEPEANIHPGALGAIGDFISMAARRTQVIVTTHSPDLLDAKWIQAENLRLVTMEEDETRISELSGASKEALQRHLMGAGEMLRANALDAAPSSRRPQEDPDDLFDKVPT